MKIPVRLVLSLIGIFSVAVRVRADWTTRPPFTATVGQSISVAASCTVNFGSTPGGGNLYIYYSYNGGANVTVATGGGGGINTVTANSSGTLTSAQPGTYVWTMAWAGGGSVSNLGGSITTTVGTPITGITLTNLTFNGAAQTPSGVSSVTPAGATVSISAPAQVNAGTYNTATVTGTGSYLGTLVNVPWTINPASAFMPTVSPSANPTAFGGSVTMTPGNGTTGLYAWLINGTAVSYYNGSGWSPASGSYADGTWSTSGVNLILTPSSATNFTVNFQDTGNANYNSATSATLSETVNQAAQTVTLSPASQSVTTGTSVTFTPSGGASGIYNWGGSSGVSGTGATKSVTFGTTGSYTVTVQDAGNSNYSPSNVASDTISVVDAPVAAVSFSASPIVFGQSALVTMTISQSASGTLLNHWMLWSGNDGVLWHGTGYAWNVPSDTGGLSGISDTGGGPTAPNSSTKSFTITPLAANAGGYQFLSWGQNNIGQGPNWNQVGLVVNKANPATSFANATKNPQSGTTFTAAAGDLVATFANPFSGGVAAPTGTVTYAISPVSPNGTLGAAVSAGSTFTAGLTYIVRATYPGDGNYSNTQVDSTWTISKASQTITFNNPGSQAAAVPLTLAATASSSLPITYTLNSGPATLSGSTLTFTGTGTVSVTAAQAGNSNWNAATNVPQSFSVVSSTQTINFPAIGNQVFGVAPLAMSATASSGLAVTYSVTSGPATVSGNVLTITGANPVTVKATQVGNSQYASVNSSQTITVSKANQSSVSINSGSTATYGSASTATATGGSSTGSLVWTLATTGSTASGAGINSSSGALSFTSTGKVIFNVYRAGDTNYNQSATTANFTVTVGARPLTVTLTGTKLWNGTTASTNANASITAGSLATGDAIGYAYAATPSANYGSYPGLATATITNGTAPTTRTGSYAITYPGNYTITGLSQTITFFSPGPQTQSTPVTLSATASSGLPVTFAVTSGPATLSGNTLSFTGTGAVTVTASQAGNGSYGPATPVPATFTVYSTFTDPGLKVLTPNN